MNTKTVLRRFGVFMLVNLFAAGACYAQATRTWVSGVGDDANPCSRTAPCKTFAGAISKTASGGTIDVLDPGGFGAVTVTKPITIESVGNVAGIQSSGVNGVIVNTPGANDLVTLRGISIDGGGSLGVNGVRVLAVGRLIIEDTVIQNFNTNGIDFEPSGNAQLILRRSRINNATNAALFVQAGAAGSANVAIADSTLSESAFGILVNKGQVTAQQAIISHNTSAGVSAVTSGANVSRINLNNTMVNGNGNGVSAVGSNAKVAISDCTVTLNTTAFQNIGGTLNTFLNNRITDNTNPGPSPTTVALQ